MLEVELRWLGCHSMAECCVLPRNHLNQPIQLAHFDPPSEEGGYELLCPVRALRAYISATADIRQSKQLFVCHGGPNRGRALTKQRLSHWVVDTITQAYRASGHPPPSGIRCHSTRSVSASWAALRGVPLGPSVPRRHGRRLAHSPGSTGSTSPLPIRWVWS